MIDLCQLLIYLNFTKDERKAKGQIDGGNVSVRYMGVSKYATIDLTSDGYRLSEPMEIVETIIPKKMYTVPLEQLLNKTLVVGKKSKYITSEILYEVSNGTNHQTT